VERDHKSGKLCVRILRQDLTIDFYCTGEGKGKLLMTIMQFVCDIHYKFLLFILRISLSADNLMSNLQNAVRFVFISDRLIQEENLHLFPNKASCLEEFFSPYVF